MSDVSKMKSIIYLYENLDLNPDYPYLISIGWERRSGKLKYNLDCRQSEQPMCLFQYTTEGEGMIELNGTLRKVKAGDAFLIERPGPYRYWLPPNGIWEFKFLSLSLSCLHYWQGITDRFGRIVEIEPNSSVMKQFDRLYSMASSYTKQEFLTSSTQAYAFIMTLHQYLLDKEQAENRKNSLQHVLDVIHTRYGTPLTLGRLTEISGLSVSHLTRMFNNTFGTSPMQYLLNYRIKMAVSLLLGTSLSVQEIARRCGFESANYFSRVFSQHIKCSPTEYRRLQAETRQNTKCAGSSGFQEVDLSKEYQK